MSISALQDTAVIGYACRFPGAPNSARFWDNLLLGQSSISRIPADRWSIPQFYDPELRQPGKSLSQWGGFLTNIYDFDPAFFAIPEDEAAYIDPQHRLLLELTYEALAHAGYTREAVSGSRVGVFIGLAQSVYEEYSRPHLFTAREAHPAILANSLRNLAAGRIAHSLDWHGPALVVDTACSSSLVALHQARLSLANGDCDLALVGGVNLNLTPTAYVAFSHAGALSPDPRSYLFDERANGFMLGEGAGVILLRQLEAAQQQGDAIYGLIKASAVNSDGRSHNPMAPRPAGQLRVLESAYGTSGVNPQDIYYIEAHGTGTLLGDAVEARSLTQFFNQHSANKTRYLGSVKPNIGHMLSAAGMGSLIKVLLLLDNQKIPPTLNVGQPRKRLRLADAGFVCNQETVPWPLAGDQLAAINAFGFGGTNAHIIVGAAAGPLISKNLPAPRYNRREYRLTTEADSVSVEKRQRADLPCLHAVGWRRRSDTKENVSFVNESRPLGPLFVLAATFPAASELATQMQALNLDCEPIRLAQLTALIAKSASPCRLLLDCRRDSTGDGHCELIWAVGQQIAAAIGQAATLPLGAIYLLTEAAISLPTSDQLKGPSGYRLSALGWAIADEIRLPVNVIDTLTASVTRQDLAALDLAPLNGHIVWRSGKAWERQIKPVDPGEKAVARVTAGGVYLITGGAAGVGAAIARGLALDVAPTLILNGRTKLNDDLARADLLAKLRWAGATADYYAADVSDYEQVEAMFKWLQTRYGRLDGIIHAAGWIEPGKFRDKQVRDLRQAHDPKGVGAENIQRALATVGFEPGFFVNFSSITTILPSYSRGLADYTAANGYLDGFAHHYGWQSINWTLWMESGRATDDRNLQQISQLNIRGLTDAEGYRYFKAALNLPGNQIAVVDPSQVTNPVVSAAQAVTESDIEPTRQLARDSEPVAQQLANLLATELEMRPEQLSHNDSFASLGLDSMDAIDLVIKLEARGFGRLPPTLFFEHNTIAKLAVYLATQTNQPIAIPSPKKDLSDLFPLSQLQRAFVSQQLLQPESVAYAYLRQTIRGRLDKTRLQGALAAVMARHEMLRIQYHFGVAGIQQRVGPTTIVPQIEFTLIDSLVSWEHELVNRPLAIAEGEVMRVAVARTTAQNKWHLAFLLHHSVADGWSLALLAQDFWSYYAGQAPSDLTTTYADYCAQIEVSGDRLRDKIWWERKYVSLSLKAPRWPRDTGAPAAPGVSQKAHAMRFDKTITQRLQTKAAEHDVSLFHWLLAVYLTCLATWLKTTEQVVGIAEARRDYNLPGILNLVGPIADVFPLTFTVEPGMPITRLAQQVRDEWLLIHRHSHVASPELARLIPGYPEAVANFSFAAFPVSPQTDMDLEVQAIWGRTATTQTKLTLVGWHYQQQLQFSWNYRDDLFTEEEIGAFSQQFESKLITSLASERSWHSEGVSGFLTRIKKRLTSGNVAFVGDRGRLHYSELAGKLGRICRQLTAGGVRPGEVVAYLGDPSWESCLTMLATFWRGATWLPLDPSSPTERLLFQMQAASATVIAGPHDASLPQTHLPTITISCAGPSAPLDDPLSVKPDAIAYIIFTSGSTGTPKGVPIRYQSLDLYLEWACSALAYHSGDVVLAATSLAFDPSLRQNLAPLMTGGAILHLSQAQARDPQQLLKQLITHQVTVWSSVPTLWGVFLSFLESRTVWPRLPLRQIQLGGESLPAAHLRRWFDRTDQTVQFVNLYGPTETTICASYFCLSEPPAPDWITIPIGSGITPVNLKVLSPDGRQCSVGQKGELVIGGPLLTPGYINDQELTERKFFGAAERFFHTGDLVEVRGDNTLIFRGRLDDQIKVRGNRVELSEIEAAVLTHPDITGSAVTFAADKQQLCAHIVAHDSDLVPADLRKYLSGRLPEYMLPHRFYKWHALPVLESGKIDRQALLRDNPKPLGPTSSQEELIGELETAVAQIWQDLLEIDNVGRHDDFFTLGGDSLAVLELMMRFRSAGFTINEAASLFEKRTVAGQATLLTTEMQNGPVPALIENHGAGEEPFRLSPAQAGFVMARRLESNVTSTWSAYFWLEGAIDPEVFKTALQHLLVRHPMLRTVYLPLSKPPQQQTIEPAKPLPLHYEIANCNGDELTAVVAQIYQERRGQRAASFDLEQWPLMHNHLICLAENQYLWMVAADHFVADAWSGWIFGSELFQIYDCLVADKPLSLEPLRTTFRDYVEHAAKLETLKNSDRDQFWQTAFAAPYQPPTDWYKPETVDAIWQSHLFEIDRRIFLKLKGRAAEMGLTAHDVLTTLFYRQLVRLTATSDLVIGTAVAGRDYPLPDLMKIFGSFATILPLRFNEVPSADIAEQVQAMGHQLARARIHKGTPRQIAQVAHPDIPITALTGLQFFISFMDFEGLPPLVSEHIEINWKRSMTEMNPPQLGTDIVLTGRALAGQLRLTVTGRSASISKAQLIQFGRELEHELLEFCDDSEPELAPERPKLDSALIGYLPPKRSVEAIAANLGIPLSSESIRQLLFPENEPRLLDLVTCSFGQSGTVCLPWFADELAHVGETDLSAAINSAMAQAVNYGAQGISLAGMLPAYTRYGFAVAEQSGLDSPALTTGHSATVVAVVKNVMAVTQMLDMKLETSIMGFLGLGSIGGAALNLFLHKNPAPAKLILCDLPAAESRLKQLAENIRREFGYTGEIIVALTERRTPTALYEADLIVGATSQPDLIEVHRLHPGTVVVDDSFPPCIDAFAAVERMRSGKDILVVGGGLLSIGPLQRRLIIPTGVSQAVEGVLGHYPDGLASCQLESLLWATQPGLPLTLGLVEESTVLAYWDVTSGLGIEAAPLHLGKYKIGRELVAELRKLKA